MRCQSVADCAPFHPFYGSSAKGNAMTLEQISWASQMADRIDKIVGVASPAELVPGHMER